MKKKKSVWPFRPERSIWSRINPRKKGDITGIFRLSWTSKAILAAVILLAGVFFAWLFLPFRPGGIEEANLPTSAFRHTVSVGGEIFIVAIADDTEEATRGLSGHPELHDREGMLFIHDAPDRYAYWMKDMFFPLDMLWINEDFRVVHIDRGIPPESFPALFRPPVPVKYVLEINAGAADENGIKIGDRLEFVAPR